MSNPISALAGAARTIYEDVVHGYERGWNGLVNAIGTGIDQPSINEYVSQSLFYLAQALEYSSSLAATSAADTIQIVADGFHGTYDQFVWLRDKTLPHLVHDLKVYAGNAALTRARQAVVYAHDITVHEAKDRALGDLREQLRLDVAIAREHADMVTRIAIEANNRIVMVQHEAADRARGDALVRRDLTLALDQARQQLTQLITQVSDYAHSLPALVDREAAGGYDPALPARASGLTRLLDTAAAHDPLIAGLVADLAKFLVDLAEVDNPLIRVAAQLILKQVIDRLGVDTAVGGLLDGILGGLLGRGKPKTLGEVAADAGGRLNAAEAGLAALAPLGPEADALHEMGTVAFDVALLGYLAAGIADPEAWADDTNAALHATVDPLLGPLLQLLGAP